MFFIYGLFAHLVGVDEDYARFQWRRDLDGRVILRFMYGLDTVTFSGKLD